MSDVKEIKDAIKELRDDMKANTAITQQGFERMNGRVKSLELKQAYQEGTEKAAQAAGIIPDNREWKKATFKLIGIIGSIVVFASTAAAIVGKVILQ